MLPGAPSFVQDLVESFQEPARPLRRVRDSAVYRPFEKMIFVGDIERGKNCEAGTINRVSLVGHCAHLAINVFGQFQNVFGVGSSQVIGLIEYLYPHTSIAGVLSGRMLGGCCHNSVLRVQLAACSSVM